MRTTLLAASVLLAALPALAQIAPPPDEADEIPVTVAPSPAPPAVVAAPVRVGSSVVAELSIDALGLYPAASGTPPLTHEDALRALEAVPLTAPSASLREALRKHLMAEWPLVEGGAAVPKGRVMARRVVLLAAYGYAGEAQQLLNLVPDSQRGEELAAAEAELLWLNGHADAGCARVAGYTATPASDLWQSVRITCLAETGKKEEAQLAVDLLDEQQQAVDPLLRASIAARISGTPLPRALVPERLTLWQQILIFPVASRTTLAGLVPQLSVPLLQRLSLDATQPEALRKLAALQLGRVTTTVAAGEWLTPARISLPPKPTDVQLREAYRAYALLKALSEPLDIEPQASWPQPAARPTRPIPPPQLDALASTGTDTRAPILQMLALLPADLTQLEDSAVTAMAASLEQNGQRPLARQFAAESIAAFAGAETFDATMKDALTLPDKPKKKEPTADAPKKPRAAGRRPH